MGYNIRGKVVLVTGANRGIGRALVEAFIEHGAAKLYAAVRDTDSAAPLVEKYGDKIVPIRLDLKDPGSISAAARTASDAEVVVSNAGVLTKSSVLDEDAIRALEYEMSVNVYGLMRMAQAFAPVLKTNGGGVFVQLNSVASMKCVPDFATYCASKAAAYSVTQGLREKLRPQGTRVISIHPGPIDTDMAVTVAEAVLAAIESGQFHVFPDTLARQLGEAYRGFAETVVEADLWAR